MKTFSKAKKLLAFLLTLAMLLSTVTSAVMVTSAADVEVWDGSVAAAFAGGSGTKDDPYLISNGAELAYMYKSVQTTGSSFSSGKYFKLTDNIYLNDVTKADWKENNPNSWFVSISTNGYRFTGNFDGDGHTVYGMYYSGDSGYLGLLPVMDSWDSDVTVKDLTISESYLSTSGSIIGAVSSRLYSDNKKTAHFYNINVTESVVIESSNKDAYVGGILGFSNCNANSFYQFSGCAVRADVSSGHALIGYGTSSTVAKIIQSYTTSANWYPTNNKSTDTAYIISDIETIKGAANAKATLKGFDWLRRWACKNDGYPYPMDYNTNNVAGHVWTGLWAADFAGGTGTSADPYIIETPEQLAKMVKFGSTTTQYFKITKDIYLNDVSKANWKENNPNSWYDRAAINKTAFVGNIDGTGHTIHGLYYNGTNMFALLPQAQETSISNLRISNSDITSTSEIAAFVSYGQVKVNFAKCVIDETVNITGSGDTAGYVAYGTPSVYIDSCASTANIKGGSNVGAFIGDCWYGTNTALDGSTVYTKHVINNSYGKDYPLDAKLGYEASNCYNTVAETKTFTDGEVVNLGDKALMQGADALKNMPLLDFFGTTDTYPLIYQQGAKGAVWSGSVAAEYAGGNGTKDDPYIVESAEQLVKLVKDANTSGKYYKLTADIKLNDTSVENWTENAKQWFAYNGAGEFPGTFGGTIIGEGHTISGLYYNGDKFYVGLFVSMKGATINNVIISESSLTSSNTGGSISAFTGYVGGAITYNGCSVDETVSLSGAQVSGYASYGSGNITIKDCTSYAAISGTTYTAAFIADVWSSTLKINNSIGLVAFSPRRSFTGSNNYGLVEDAYGTNVVTEEQIKGLNALDNMPLLDGYYATDSYPARYTDSVAGTTWSGGVARKFTSGSGTNTDPYIITTGEQLARMLAISSKDVYFKLGADIVLSDENVKNNWFDSTNSTVFEGELNGNGYIISGLYYEGVATSMMYAGFIPKAKNAYISNVILEDSVIALETNGGYATYVGGIVGYITGNTNIYSCYVADSVNLYNISNENSAEKKNSIGGILGGGESGFTIDGCAFFGTIYGFDYRYGSVFGDVWGGNEATRIVKYTMADKVVPSSRWGFSGSHNVSTVEPAMLGENSTDINGSFTVAKTLKGEEGFAAAKAANWNNRYFGTEGYPMLSTMGKRYNDVNGDRICDTADLVVLRKNLIGSSVLGFTDINGDGKGNIKDLVWLKKKFARETAPKSGYELVWYDEFEGTAIDDTKWNTAQTRMSDTNELAQSNMGSVRSVSDGNLQLTAMVNPYYNANSESYFERHKYMTTGSVTTEGKMSYQYGYLEIRAKVPYKSGCWPSFWLRSHNATEKQANPDFEVEVDVFEVFGSQDTMASNLHQQNYNGQSYQTGGGIFDLNEINEKEKYTFDNAENLSDEYHTYAFEWEPNRMAIYVDGELSCEWSIDRWSLLLNGLKGNTSGFNTTMNILFNNHLFTESSEYNPGATIEDNDDSLPAEFDIDYVRLYQKNDGVSRLIIE